MKKIKHLNLFIVLTLICSMFMNILTAQAAPSATVGFSGNSTVSVGSNITITMYVSNVVDTTGGIVSVGGNLSFDSEYLEYVSGTGTSSPYTFQINPSANYIIAGLDTTLSNGITGSSQTKVFTFVFKAKKQGTTQVTLTNAKLSDVSSKIGATVSPKTITITGNTPSTPDTPSTPTKSSDATLKSLSATGYTLSPSFSPSTTSYTIKVPSSATTVKLEGTVNDAKAKVSGLGNITLTGNTTTATIKVTAEDGTVKTYTVKIEKEVEEQPSETQKKDNDATLKSLNMSGYTLSPTFKSSINTYSIKVKNNITSLDVKAIPNSSKAKVSVSGNTGWKEGNNVVTIKVTAEDGTVNTYIVNVNREAKNNDSEKKEEKSNDSYLKSLIINSSHDIDNKFDKNVSSYNITVPYEVEKLDLSYATNDSKANATITGNENFKVGEVNTVQIEVTAEDGTKRYYTLNVTRSTKSSDNDLEDLVIEGADINPKFSPDILDYTVKVDGDTDKLNIKATPKTDGAKVEIIGNDNLKPGKNTVLVKVTDKNGFSKYYTIEVEKAKKDKQAIKIFGLTPLQFGLISGIIGLLLLLLLILLFRRKKKEEKEEKTVTPIIEVKPEFNFGSKNTTDDDIVHGNLNQNSELSGTYEEPKHKAIEARYEDVPYDPYDDIVTKDELIDAINEVTRTKDASKLKMLLEQEALNRKKEELKKRDMEEEMDDWGKY